MTLVTKLLVTGLGLFALSVGFGFLSSSVPDVCRAWSSGPEICHMAGIAMMWAAWSGATAVAAVLILIPAAVHYFNP